MNYNYFPLGYQPTYYGNPYYQQMQNQAMMQQAQQTQQAQQMQQTQQAQIQQPSIQQSGFVLVQSEQEARSYPVAPGNSITFKDERQPYCYVKTMGFNQLDQPIFERYRLVKEETPEMPSNLPDMSVSGGREGKDTMYALKSDLEAIWGEIQALKERHEAQPEKSRAKAKKEEAE